MKVKEFLGSGPAGIFAGAMTVLLGGGAVAVLAFGNSSPELRPMGDSRLGSGNQAFDAMIVTNAGATDLDAAGGSSDGMADGSPVAGPAAGVRRAASDAVPATSPTQARTAARSDAPPVPGSAAYYRALLSTGAMSAGSGSLGSLAMLPGGAMGRTIGGGDATGYLTGENAVDYTRDRASTVVGDPLVPSRAFASYGSNDAGSSSAGSNGGASSAGNSRPAVGTSPVGPASANGSSAAGPVVSTPAAAPIVTPPSLPARNTHPTSSSGASDPSSLVNPVAGPLSSSPSPTVTDPLGEARAPWAGGNVEHQPDSPSGTPAAPGTPGAKPAPPVTSVVSPTAIVTPEPGTWLLVGSGLLALGLIGRRRAGRTG